MIAPKKLSLKILALLCLLIVIGCGKQDNPDVPNNPDPAPEIFIRCKINGIQRQFNYGANANDKPTGTVVPVVTVSGKETGSQSAEGFGITLLMPAGIEEITYQNTGNIEPELDGKYYIQHAGGGTTVYMGGSVPGTHFTLKITSLTAWGVKGTFSGLLENISAPGTTAIITDGEFSAPYN